ncbi:MAG: hypothetical protein U5O39_06345 [Gammaproteobacteria bacterium]|nr:hypothetical protein [Gammaproteobacteria bacterium]
MYEIPKIQVPVVLHLINEESIPGKVFVTEDLVSPAGNPEVDDYLNEDPDQFFSFQSDAGAYRLVNKSQVVYMETNQDDAEIKAQTPLDPRSLVIHFVNATTLYGIVYPTLAEEARVSDILNAEGNFTTLFRQGRKLIINLDKVVYVNAN